MVAGEITISDIFNLLSHHFHPFSNKVGPFSLPKRPQRLGFRPKSRAPLGAPPRCWPAARSPSSRGARRSSRSRWSHPDLTSSVRGPARDSGWGIAIPKKMGENGEKFWKMLENMVDWRCFKEILWWLNGDKLQKMIKLGWQLDELNNRWWVSWVLKWASVLWVYLQLVI